MTIVQNITLMLERLYKNSKLVTFFLLSLATAFSILYQGYYFGRVDQGFFLAYIKELVNPHLFPNDFLMNALTVLFPGYLWKVIAVFYRFINLEILMLGLHIIFRFLFFLGLYLLTYFVTRKKAIAYLNVFFWFTSKPSLGYDIFYNNFVQSQFVFPVLLFSSYFYLTSRYVWSFILLIIAFYTHQPLAVPFLIIFFALWFIKRRFSLLVRYSLLLFISIIPLYTNVFTIIQKVGSYDLQWLEIMRIRNAHHLFPFSWGISPWLHVFFFLSFIVSFYLFFSKKIKDEVKEKITFFLFIPLLVVLLSTIFIEIIPIPRIVTFAPFHTSSVFTLFSSIVISLCIWLLIQNKSLFIRFIAFIVAYIYFFNQYSLQFSKLFVILLPLCLLIFLLFRNNLKIFFITLLLITGILLPYMYKRNQTQTDTYYNKWVETQQWARHNTSIDALFIVPIYLESFRLYSERSIVVDWKDGGVGFFSSIYLKEWWRRMEDIGLTKENYDEEYQKYIYNAISSQKAEKLLRKYNAKYIVLEKDTKLNLKKAYKNEHFVVYQY